MKFSLILSTFGRSEEVDFFLSRLTEQIHKDIEVVIVDQNRDNRLLPIVEKYGKKLDLIHFKTEPGPGSVRFPGVMGCVTKRNVWIRSVSYTIFIRRNVLSDIRFDENLGLGSSGIFGSGEETDFLLQALEKGNRIFYNPEIKVFHRSPVSPVGADQSKRAFRCGAGTGRVIRKHDFPVSFI